jgi:hypothetical protein
VAGPIRDSFDRARAVVEAVREATARAGPASRAAPVATRAQIEAAIAAFVRTYIRADAWEIIVPGEHSGGITHQGLFAVLASQGRDFFQSTIQLYQAVAIGLRREHLTDTVVPTVEKMKRTSEPLLLDHVEARMSKRGNADISVTALTARYAAEKRRRGRGMQPIGVASGELRRALSRSAKVKWKK